MEFMTIKEAAEKWNLSVRRVQTICNEGMIEGTMKFGNTWAIPKNAVKPADKRIKVTVQSPAKSSKHKGYGI